MSSTIKHSIIIPHLGRERHLQLCLRSLSLAYDVYERNGENPDIEVLVCGEWNSPRYWPDNIPVRYIPAATSPPFLKLRPNEPPPFWKNRLLNVGISESHGDMLTFLDADAIVGSGFLWRFGIPTDAIYLGYRVRSVSLKDTTAAVEEDDDFRRLFRQYDWTHPNGTDVYPKKHEAYGKPEDGEADASRRPIFGNSQFSIRRSVLGDLRWDENYWGRGHEDLSMIRTLQEIHTPSLCAIIEINPFCSMFHIHHDPSPGFNHDRWADRNRRRYYREKCLWVVSGDRGRLESFKLFLCGEWVQYRPNIAVRFRLAGDFDPQEANEHDVFLSLDESELTLCLVMEKNNARSSTTRID